MKKFIKTLIATTLLLSTLIALCVPSAAASFSDVAETHWAYENINKISDTGLMIGRGTPGGVVFDPERQITGVEIYETLYRIAEGHYSENCYTEKFSMLNIHSDKWYSDSYEWALKNGIAEITYHTPYVEPGKSFDNSFAIIYGRHGNINSLSELDKHAEVPDALRGAFSGYNAENHATRSDVILSLYFYITTYLGIEVTERYDLSVFSDWNYDDFEPDPYIDPDRDTIILPKSCTVVSRVYSKEFVPAWEWAVGSGIIKGCGDGTLSHIKSADGQFRYITRAEYAVILDRFTAYLETLA